MKIHESTRVLASYKEISMSNTIQPNEETQEPEPRETSRQEPSSKGGPSNPFNPDEWERRLKEAGWRNGALDPGGPTAFELPGHRPPKAQESEDSGS
jgi:hypothetical protein